MAKIGRKRKAMSESSAEICNVPTLAGRLRASFHFQFKDDFFNNLPLLIIFYFVIDQSAITPSRRSVLKLQKLQVLTFHFSQYNDSGLLVSSR